MYFVRETPSTVPEAYAIFQVLRQDTTVKSTDILKQSFTVLNLFYFVLFYTTYMTGYCELCQILNREQNSEHSYNCAHLYLYILYRRPSR